MKQNEQQEQIRRLTVDQLRKYKGCENLTDEEADNAIKTLAELSYIAWDIISKNKIRPGDPLK